MVTVRDTPLWSGADADAVQFTLAPAGSYVRPLSSAPTGRILVDYTGDGKARKPGQAWVSHADLAPGGPPPWIASSEIDGLTASPPAPGTLTRVGYAPPPVVSAAQIAVVDEASGLLLYGQAPHEPEEPASTTKIATALVTLQKAPDLDRVVPITINGFAMASRDGSSIMGLEPGERLSLRTLLYGLLLPSGNDAAEQLALVVAPSREQYVAWMNDLVASLGLHDTHFVNPSGLDDPDHLASAYDLAQMARAAMRDQTFRTIVASPTYKAEGYLLQGHNPLLGEYPGVDGVKTGTTDLAGHAMVASATRGGHRVYVVVMHSDDLLADCSALFDWVWDSFSWPAGSTTAVSNTPAIAPSRVASPSPVAR
jgi:D-alanyl-D-alanine carboxypeptidase